MTDQLQPTQPDEHRYYPEDEIELMDYLLVIWKWKYIIIAGTFAFALTAAIISFIIWKQQPQMYRTSMVLKPIILTIDEKGKKVFIDTPENIKALIENDLKYKVLEQSKNSNNTKLATALDFQVDIAKDSNMINISIRSASPNEGTTKLLNYLIKALMTEYNYKQKEEIDKQIEQKKILLAQLKEMEIINRRKIENSIVLKKHVLDELSLKEKSIKTKIAKYQQELSEIESNMKFLKDNKDISQSNGYFLTKLSIENDYRNTFQKYFELNENAKFNLFELQGKIFAVSNKIKDLEKAKNNIKAAQYLQSDQSDLYQIQKDIIKVPKEIETLEKEKLNIQNIQVIQPPVTSELPITNKIKRNVVLSSMTGFFLMLFSSFILEYLSNYKKRRSKTLQKNT